MDQSPSEVKRPGETGTKSVNVKKTSFAPEVSLLSGPRGDTQTLVCTIENFLPKEFSVKWKKNGNDVTGSFDSDPKTNGETYSALSTLNIKNTDWDSKAVYTCEVTHRQKTYTRKASKDLITLTLNQPSPKEIFSNNQAKLECVITGQDKPTVDESTITWQINGNDVTNNISESAIKSENSQHIKTSTMTRSLTEWQSVNNVRCSATKEDMTPVFQVLTVRKGDGKKPKVTIHVMPENDIQKEESVTLVCLVSSTVQQDYYIAWSEYIGQNDSIYKDGINYPPQKTQNGYSVTSVYITTNDKWDTSTFGCNVWFAGGNDSVHKNVSKDHDFAPESKLGCALSCTDDAIEEDEFSSLWSTTSSFIFLFISSLFYSMIFSLVKMKRQ
ncbi:Ig mu chain C region membrane-bound form [Larimichthys crocea]|uniref:Ig mu chain C region membrane-bound form n=1 Tax=Larimichthys crocea TaxID=215358 RepID=A0A6G0HV60_LARCR|nr:Ig mu chain C region membrane-bound form [Larimichthys crocea]